MALVRPPSDTSPPSLVRKMSPSSTAATSVSVSDANVDALGHEFQLELGEVFDDAVVDQGQLAAVGQVRVRVLVRGAAVRGPAGVADAGQRLRQRVLLQLGERLLSLPDFFRDEMDPSETTATPAESYPRYSRRRKPSRTTSNAL